MNSIYFPQNIEFTVNNAESAKIIFEDALELEIILKSKSLNEYWLNENTILTVWTDGSIARKSINDLLFIASEQSILNAAEKLKTWDGDISLRINKNNIEEEALVLYIEFPGRGGMIRLSNMYWSNYKSKLDDLKNSR